GGGGVSRYTFENGKAEYWNADNVLPGNHVTAIIETVEKETAAAVKGTGVDTWIATLNNGLARFDGTVFKWLNVGQGGGNNRVYALSEGEPGEIWAGTETGLHRLKNGAWQQVNEADGLSRQRVTALEWDETGVLWVGTLKGMFRSETMGRKNGGMTFKPVTDTDGLLSGCMVHDVLTDKAGGVYAATNHGLFRVSGGKAGIRRMTLKPQSFDKSVISLYRDTEGVLWLGTLSTGFGNWYPGRFRTVSTADGLSNPHVTAMYADDSGTVWTGTGGGGLNRFKNGSVTVYGDVEGLNGRWITAVTGDGAGKLWVATETGLFEFREERFVPLLPEKRGMLSYIPVLYADPVGNLWGGISRGGMFRYNPASGSGGP
ncbi:MAG: hypothetical protein MI867_26510, partial [Pseudomonadales bacterium]|nr:hypothetical protein [Pseudomonadales bacterium]